MDTEKRELWDQLTNEPRRAFEAFRLSWAFSATAGRIIEAYRVHVGNPKAVEPSDTWTRWIRDFAWSERAEAYDNHLASLRRDAYERAAEWLENAQPSDLRAQDVMQIIRLHMDYVKAFEVERQSKDEDDWTEEDERTLVERILPKIEALEDADEGFGADLDESEEDLRESEDGQD